MVIDDVEIALLLLLLLLLLLIPPDAVELATLAKLQLSIDMAFGIVVAVKVSARLSMMLRGNDNEVSSMILSVDEVRVGASLAISIKPPPPRCGTIDNEEDDDD